MPSGTTYHPYRSNELDANKVISAAQGVSTNFIANTSSNLDLTMTDDCLLTGLVFFTVNANNGDFANLQVVDTTGITGYPAGTVLAQFATNWYVNPSQQLAMDIQYPAKIIAGLTLRMVYTNTGSSPVFSAINYKLHKCLV